MSHPTPHATLRWDGSWYTAEPYRYETDDGWIIEVPARFETDLASVPRLLWPIIGPHELSPAAAVVHDFLYRRPTPFDRREADRLLRAIALEHPHVTKWRVEFGYLAVRLFGWVAWRGEQGEGGRRRQGDRPLTGSRDAPGSGR